MIKDLIKNVAGRMGYGVRNWKYTPVQFVNNVNALKITFDHVICHHMAQMSDVGSFSFIQVGAFDGKECDPLYRYIDRYQWEGILVEPQPTAFRKLQELHGMNKRLKLVNAAISRTVLNTKFYVLEGEGLPPWAKGMASLDPENILKHGNIIPCLEKYIKETVVGCTTFEKLFREFPVTRLDLLQIDTEGYDAEIIYMFPFAHVKPSIIHFECKHLSKEPLEKLLSYLVDMNYYVAYDGQEDMLAVLNDRPS